MTRLALSHSCSLSLAWWLGGVVVKSWICDIRIAGSSTDRDTARLFLTYVFRG